MILSTYVRLPFRSGASEQVELRDIALRAREAVCNGEYDQALEILRLSDGIIQHLSVLYLSGNVQEASSLAAKYVCASNADWCYWCIGQMYSEENADSRLQRHTNDQARHYSSGNLMSLGPLQCRWFTGLTITRKAPISIAGVTSERDNYVEYLTLPVAGSVIRYRLKGIVTGEDAGSCIFPRLVFSGEKGDYLGEIALRYDIKDKFEVELWWPLSPDVKSITPRITFDESCFAQGQEIVICSTDLAVIP